MAKKQSTNHPYHELFKKKLNELISEVAKGSGKRASYEIEKNKNYINNLITGQHYPSFERFYLIYDTYNVPPKYFFDDEPEFPPHIIHMINNIMLLPENEQYALSQYLEMRASNLKLSNSESE